MASKNGTGNGRLEEAIAVLLQNQATFVQSQATFQTQMAEMRKEHLELERSSSERFARIEAILIEHSRILHALPDAVREKIGFKPPQ